jgi:hypothetical protein
MISIELAVCACTGQVISVTIAWALLQHEIVPTSVGFELLYKCKITYYALARTVKVSIRRDEEIY